MPLMLAKAPELMALLPVVTCCAVLSAVVPVNVMSFRTICEPPRYLSNSATVKILLKSAILAAVGTLLTASVLVCAVADAITAQASNKLPDEKRIFLVCMELSPESLDGVSCVPVRPKRVPPAGDDRLGVLATP